MPGTPGATGTQLREGGHQEQRPSAPHSPRSRQRFPCGVAGGSARAADPRLLAQELDGGDGPADGEPVSALLLGEFPQHGGGWMAADGGGWMAADGSGWRLPARGPAPPPFPARARLPTLRPVPPSAGALPAGICPPFPANSPVAAG